MGLLDTLKKNREQMQINKQKRLASQETARIKAQASYDVEYQKAAAKAVKGRARRDAMERFGYSKAERRGRQVQKMTKGLEGLGNWAGGTGRGSSHRSTGKKGGKHRSAPRKKQDPFDLGDFDDIQIF